jgi:alkanesulfonate monooxygenase SsuD/methylene tetrahydromethanopterin reductase-like flavin-dependent oxidoreductase (luciferase family)
VGWNYVEFEGLGADFHDRGRRLEEQVNVIRKLWTEPVVNYRGVDHRLDRVGIRPLPDRSIPVWFGGFRDDALQRAARIGDGFIVAGPAADVSGRVAQLHQMLESNGRDPRDFGIDVIEQYQPDLRKLEHSIRERIRVGATHLTLRTLGAGLDTAEAHLDAMESCTQVFRRITAY